MTFGKSNIYVGFVMAGKTTNEKFEQWELDAPTRPRFGRNWWYWFPSIRTNGGRFRKHETTDVNFHWLCFAAWITVYCRMKLNVHAQPTTPATKNHE